MPAPTGKCGVCREEWLIPSRNPPTAPMGIGSGLRKHRPGLMPSVRQSSVRRSRHRGEGKAASVSPNPFDVRALNESWRRASLALRDIRSCGFAWLNRASFPRSAARVSRARVNAARVNAAQHVPAGLRLIARVPPPSRNLLADNSGTAGSPFRAEGDDALGVALPPPLCWPLPEDRTPSQPRHQDRGHAGKF